jgi:DNA-binding CsgD family transcriptional regulator
MTGPLSVREITALHLIATGSSLEQAGDFMYLSPETVKHYLHTAYKALGVHERGHAIGEAFRRGYLAVDPLTNTILANPYRRPVRHMRRTPCGR